MMEKFSVNIAVIKKRFCLNGHNRSKAKKAVVNFSSEYIFSVF